MYCNQCEQTSKGVACTTRGVCGKDEVTASLQDLLTGALKGMSINALEARKQSGPDLKTDHLLIEALFSTLTNVNFDPERLKDFIIQVVERGKTIGAGESLALDYDLLTLSDNDSIEALAALGSKLELPFSRVANPDIRSLQEILLYGVRGVAAYAHHAAKLGHEDQAVYDFIYQALAVLGNEVQDLNYWVGMVMKCGEINILAMQLLDAGHTETYGHPQPTAVPLGHKTGHCILVSGHDLKDLQLLLEATRGQQIQVYSHGEMLPAHGYPELKKYEHFYGHYGSGWQNQVREFAAFPGPVLMTTNCIQKPALAYIERIYTTGPVGWPGVSHLAEGEFQPLIEKALSMPGFSDDIEAGKVMVGFARQSVLGVAGAVVEAVKAGKIKHFLLVGGCDGVHKERSYYAELVEKAPRDTVILTLGCGKFRFFDQHLGDIEGIPRLLDVGQCNDAYSAVQIAQALAQAFDCGVNDLPLSLVLSWFEQKAVSILLSLFYLGIKNIRLGPSLPAFVSPNVLQVLVDNFAIQAISEPEKDLQAILGA